MSSRDDQLRSASSSSSRSRKRNRRRRARGGKSSGGSGGASSGAEANHARAAERQARAAAAMEARRASPIHTDIDSDLPIAQHAAEIRAQLSEHQVIVVCGETGSGKSTQLPKICIQAGRGIDGMIAHTQPRRLAARTLAKRIADECRTPLGQGVGYQVRFAGEASDATRVQLMTDGILLASIRRDRLLRAYDTIIIDEAHERSLNIDFLLGYLKQILPKRPDLRVIVTSATIDPDRFRTHFGGAPVTEVSGRTFPVEIRYRGAGEEVKPGSVADSSDVDQRVASAVTELLREPAAGDMLVFLPGEGEIRAAARRLRQTIPAGTIDILPLYARLPAADQQRIFEPAGEGQRRRRVVLATNVAETSLTVPGIRSVIDSGLARISRYAPRTKVQRLPIEPVSQASAKQRAGRCGRVAPGICLRLYSESDFAARDEFTSPEILRTNLAHVILQMKSLKLGPIEKFPFVEPPRRAMIRDGFDTLAELGAIDGHDRLTSLGQEIARMPVDPRLARIMLAGRGEGCARDATALAAALAIPDPREDRADNREAARQARAEFQSDDSDFLTLLTIFDAWHAVKRTEGSSALRRWTKKHHLSWTRMREWHDLERQLMRELTASSRPRSKSGDATPIADTKERDAGAIHRALLTGLLSNVGKRTDDPKRHGEFDAARGGAFRIFRDRSCRNANRRGSCRRRSSKPQLATHAFVLAFSPSGSKPSGRI